MKTIEIHTDRNVAFRALDQVPSQVVLHFSYSIGPTNQNRLQVDPTILTNWNWTADKRR